MPVGSSKIRRHALRDRSSAGSFPGGSRTASLTSNEPIRTTAFPASTLARSSTSSTSVESPSAAWRMNLDLLLLLGGQVAVAAREQEARQALDRVERRAELVAHLGEEAGLEIGKTLEGLGAFVELGVEGHHASVGLVELAAVHLGDLRLAVAQFLKGVEQLLVLLLELFQQPLRGVLRQLGRDPAPAPAA